MYQPEDLPDRVTKLEREMAVVWEHASAARMLASAVDGDIATNRIDMRGHTQALNALRETQLEQSDALATLRQAQGEQFAIMHQILGEHSEQLSGLGQVQGEHSEQLSSLRQVQGEHGAQLSSLRQVQGEHGAQLSRVETDLVEVKSGIAHITGLLTGGKEAGQQG
ncbi:MAG: hypothetical protein ACJ72N_21380 [Labedaea sp.]